MLNATITSKGQITIPVEIRKALKLNAGDKIGFEETEPGEFAFKAAKKNDKTATATALKGMFGPAEIHVSIEAMNTAIAKRAATWK